MSNCKIPTWKWYSVQEDPHTLFKLYFLCLFILYMWMFCSLIYLHILHSLNSQIMKEGFRSPGTNVTEDCESSCHTGIWHTAILVLWNNLSDLNWAISSVPDKLTICSKCIYSTDALRKNLSFCVLFELLILTCLI